MIPTKSHLLKIIYAGNPRVGKTSINNNFMDQGFSESYMKTMGLNISKYEHHFKDQPVTVTFWDVGYEDFVMGVRQSIFVGSDGIVLVFDLSRPFNPDEDITNWINEIFSAISGDVPVVILGNKLDLEDQRQVTEEEGRRTKSIVKNYTKGDVEYFETSAKTGHNIKNAIEWLIEKVISDGMI